MERDPGITSQRGPISPDEFSPRPGTEQCGAVLKLSADLARVADSIGAVRSPLYSTPHPYRQPSAPNYLQITRKTKANKKRSVLLVELATKKKLIFF